jgi:hypothetical protein
MAMAYTLELTPDDGLIAELRRDAHGARLGQRRANRRRLALELFFAAGVALAIGGIFRR